MKIEEILQAVKKSEGDFINSILPKALQDRGFRTFYLDERLLVLRAELPSYTLLINIRHETDDCGKFRMWVSKPEYYSDIVMGAAGSDTEARVYLECLAALFDEKFTLIMQQHLKMFDERVVQLKNDLDNVKEG